jgi:bifunctional DNA-binding transcriptional regulator/antitoxin component of YhaV-PrlF toxin-antitoxin module
MKMTDKGQVTIPSMMRKKHGLAPHAEIAFVDQPNGVLVMKAAKRTRGKQVVAQLMRGGVVKARTKDWLKMTRGQA